MVRFFSCCGIFIIAMQSACVSNVGTVSRSANIYDHPYNKVWGASVRSISKMGMVIQTSDKEGGLIVAEGGRNRLLHNSNPHLSVFLTDLDGRTEVECTGAMRGQLVDYGASSRNARRFFQNLENHLGSGPLTASQETSPSDEASSAQ